MTQTLSQCACAIHIISTPVIRTHQKIRASTATSLLSSVHESSSFVRMLSDREYLDHLLIFFFLKSTCVMSGDEPGVDHRKNSFNLAIQSHVWKIRT